MIKINKITVSIIVIIIFFVHSNVYGKKYKHLNSGGQINVTFGRLAGVRDGGERLSGYGWLSSYSKINQDFAITTNMGMSFEGHNPYSPILNDLNIGLQSNTQQLFLGRSLNAAGKLHHDIIDFGAPGAGSDNTPVSYFFNGNYTTNVAQKLTLPFTQRIAYYIKPYKDFFALGISYAPTIGTYHPENYHFFSDFQSHDEISLAQNSVFQLRNIYVGFTYGYTQAYRPFNNRLPQGLIKAHQYSIFIKEALSRHTSKQYELNSGCLNDKQTKDCRAGFQFSKTKNNNTYNIGTHIRYEDNAFNPSINSDYFVGWSWALNPNIQIGLETIFRLQETKNKRIGFDTKINKQNDFNWLAGIQYRF